MSYRTNEDNIYKVGSVITARENPTQKLLIEKYYQRIYYCSILPEDPSARLKVYFQKDLIAPAEVL
jgi:hypothetical protein